MEERDEVLLKLKEAVDLFVNTPGTHLLIPEIRTNIGYAIKGAKNVNDVAAIPGRISAAFNRAIYCMPPAFGASDHVARVILTAMSHDENMRSVINLKFYEEIVKNLSDVFIFNRKEEPEESREKERHTMNFMVDLAYSRLGRIPRYIVDLGDYGKEPSIFILGKEPIEVVKEAINLLQFIQ
ncbi:phosphomethylpyrimidine kinase [Acidianus hospitalis]|uniref:Phosphomethylpyrimidine kinase n=1 Tax=Acidianus hospitalis TaxID=563177 RepID=A0A2T9X1P0_9CREN|nr:phosphomethylpyrimidine kinase [Acidianus hospitalis]